jgi:hypothetical protein
MMRHLLKAAALILIGAAISVAVAWGCALWCDCRAGHPCIACVGIGGEPWWIGVDRWRGFGTNIHDTRTAIRPRATGEAILSDLAFSSAPLATGYLWDDPLPRLDVSWSRLGIGAHDQGRDLVLGEQANGWPARCMWAGIHGYHAAPLRNALALSTRRTELGDSFTDQRLLPLRPIWRGLFIDAVCYGGMIWLFMLGVSSMRRRHRRRVGRCERCGYELRGLLEPGCPECGWNRREAAS